MMIWALFVVIEPFLTLLASQRSCASPELAESLSLRSAQYGLVSSLVVESRSDFVLFCIMVFSVVF